jgi:hypothetical protein
MIRTLCVLLIASCVFIQTTNALEAIVALKTTKSVDIKALKNVAGVAAVYRLGPEGWFYSVDGRGTELQHPWNFVVVGNGFKDKSAQEAFLSEVSGMSFVELYAGYRLSVSSLYDADKLNKMMKKADPKHFVKRPMKAASPLPDCRVIDLKKGERLILMSMSRTDKTKAAMKMARELVLRGFPPLGVSYKYVGEVDSSEVWEDFSIMDFIDVKTWCEHVQSQFAKDIGPIFARAMKAVAGGLVVQV